MKRKRDQAGRRKELVNVVTSARAYERWLRRRMPLIRADLMLRRRRVATNAFAFLRGSFFRWAEVFPVTCRQLLDAPAVLGVGDLHVENFGTWGAADDNLYWGVNDFDEAAVLPYTNDLVRLATSALLSSGKNAFALSAENICAAILDGYRACLKRGGKPIRVTSNRTWAQSLLSIQPSREKKFWRQLTGLRSVRGADPQVVRAIKRAIPRAARDLRIVHRQGGLGSLGRPRFTGLADVEGLPVAREAKRLTSSAWQWHEGRLGIGRSRYAQLLDCIVRVPDPSLRVADSWVVRRIAPEARRIELIDLPGRKHHRKLLRHMGWDTANVHLGTRDQRGQILADLEKRSVDWLSEAAQLMADQTCRDWRDWKASRASRA